MTAVLLGCVEVDGHSRVPDIDVFNPARVGANDGTRAHVRVRGVKLSEGRAFEEDRMTVLARTGRAENLGARSASGLSSRSTALLVMSGASAGMTMIASSSAPCRASSLTRAVWSDDNWP